MVSLPTKVPNTPGVGKICIFRRSISLLAKTPHCLYFVFIRHNLNVLAEWYAASSTTFIVHAGGVCGAAASPGACSDHQCRAGLNITRTFQWQLS